MAGGVNVITSHNLHQNLSAAAFLNPNGSSRAFDVAASGYRRGEGGGMIVLKPLARAISDGGLALGVTATLAINQGFNCNLITVPDLKSQSSLYERVLFAAEIELNEVTYVEAHNTGKQELNISFEHAKARGLTLSARDTYRRPHRVRECPFGAHRPLTGLGFIPRLCQKITLETQRLRLKLRISSKQCW